MTFQYVFYDMFITDDC